MVRSRAMTTKFQIQIDLSTFTREQMLLHNDVRRDLRATDAIFQRTFRANSRARAKGHLHEAIEVDGKIDVAGIAMFVRVQFVEAARRLFCSATHWAEN